MVHKHIPVSAIVLTRNETTNIARCLEAMNAIADVVVVDSFSTDDTLSLAETARSDVRIFLNAFKDFGDQRNWALDNCEPKYPWVLFVDADEFCTPAFLDELAAFVAKPEIFVGAFIAGKNYFLGHWLKHSTLYPSYQLRLLKLGQVRYRKEGHGQREVTDGPLHYFIEGWHHNGFSKGVYEWIERHNRYSSHEVALIERLRAERIEWHNVFKWKGDPIARRRALKRLGAKIPLRPLMRFLYAYIWRRGFLDGYPGLLYCLLRVAHDIHILAKLAERRNQDINRR
ncbi:MAG: glycosyltransferase family 2 protein [Gammaproteobacteria bacterium]|nr:glycosyltransferase family 2 protein [Gammaproteobacteria bacterium]